MDVLETYRRSLTEFTDRVAQINRDQWNAPTPCQDWNLRTLVNHVVSEDRWTVPLLAGATIDQVGDRFDGDVLGADPLTSAQQATEEADLAASEAGALDRTVHLSSADTPAREYVYQLLTDHLVHTWDVAVAIEASPRIDARAVHEALSWFADQEDSYRSAGLVGPRVEVPPDAPEQDRLLAAFGRDPAWRPAV
ncbi:MAG TPA: TIGR03086 family metal-binding protein [Micromonosporaceae bacterium]|nr:TIGR03086 family metal-binding protein [Micromonosporaceae bacterium]